MLAARASQQIQPEYIRKVQIEDEQIVFFAGECLDRMFSVGALVHMEARAIEHCAYQHQCTGLIVDDKRIDAGRLA